MTITHPLGGAVPEINRETVRSGQTREVTGIFCHANGGADPLIVSMNGLKASQSADIVDPLAGPQEVHSDEGRLRQLAEQFLARRGAGLSIAAE